MSRSETKNVDSIITIGAVWAIAQIAVRLLSLICRVKLVRIVGTRDMGFYAVAYQVYQFLVPVFTIGIPTALSSLIVTYSNKKESGKIQMIFKSTLIFALIVGAIYAGIIFFCSGLISRFIFNVGDGENVLKFMAPAMVLVAIPCVFRGYFQGLGANILSSISMVIERAVWVVAAVGLAYELTGKGTSFGAGGGILGLSVGAAAASVFCIVIYLILRKPIRAKAKRSAARHKLNKKHKRNSKSGKLSFADVVGLVAGVAIPTALGQIVFSLTNITDTLMFSRLLGFREYSDSVRMEMYGIYFGEFSLILEAMLVLTAAAGTSMFVGLTEKIRENDQQQVHKKMTSMIRMTMTVAMPISIGLMVLSVAVMQLTFRDVSGFPANILLVGAPMIAMYSLSTLTMLMLQAVRQKQKAPVANTWIALFVHIVAVIPLLLYTDLNIYAIIFGNYIFTFVLTFLNMQSLRKHSGYQEHYGSAIVMPLIAALIMGLVSWLSYRGLMLVFSNMIFAFVVSAILSVAVYCLAVIIFDILSEEEIRSLPFGSSIVRLCKKIHAL